MVLKAIECEIFPSPTDNHSEQSEQSEQPEESEQPKLSERLSEYHKYISLESNNNLNISSSVSHINVLIDSGNLLFIQTRTGR